MKCERCHKAELETSFLKTKDKSLYPICNNCITELAAIDKINILQFCKDFDVPYIKILWDECVEKSNKKAPMCLYIRTMLLASYFDWTFRDSDKLNERYNKYAYLGR